MLWLQGWDNAPELAWACRNSWERMNPTWEVRPLSLSDIASLLPADLPPGTRPAHISDIARVELLHKYGGVWADATVFCWQPLDEWLPLGHDFFAFARPAPGRPIASWLLAAPYESVVAQRWAAATRTYWSSRTVPPQDYYWFHHLFARLLRTDSEFRELWQSVPQFSANGPHYFVPYKRRFYRGRTAIGLSRRFQARLASGIDPVYKLRHVPNSSQIDQSASKFFVGGAQEQLASSPRLAAVDNVYEHVRWKVRHVVDGLLFVLRRIRAFRVQTRKQRHD